MKLFLGSITNMVDSFHNKPTSCADISSCDRRLTALMARLRLELQGFLDSSWHMQAGFWSMQKHVKEIEVFW